MSMMPEPAAAPLGRPVLSPQFGLASTPAPGQHARSSAPPTGHWKHAPILAALMLAFVGARAHEQLGPLKLIRPALLLSVISLLLLLANSSTRTLQIAAHDRVFRIACCFFAWAVIGTPFSLWPGQSVSQLMTVYPALMLIFSVLMVTPTFRSLDRLTVAFLIGTCITVVGIKVKGSTIADRLTSFGSLDSNDIAALCALCVPFALAFITRGKRYQRPLGLAAVGLLVMIIVDTGSRGGILALVAGTFVYLMGLRGARRWMMLIACVLGGALTWSLGPQSLRDRMIGLFQNPESDYNYTNYTGRKAIWQRARGYILDNPVLGVGIGAFPVAEGNYCESIGRTCKWSAPHNSYLQAGAELGVPGMLIFIGMLLTGAYQVRHLYWPKGRANPPPGFHRPELLASLASFASSAYFLSHAYFFALFGILGLTSLAALVVRHEGSLLAAKNGAQPMTGQGQPASGGQRRGQAPRPLQGQRGFGPRNDPRFGARPTT
jgi:O-antigen ligase